MNLKEQVSRIEKQYRNAGEKWPAAAVTVAEWGFARNLIEIPRGALIRQFAEKIAQVWGDEYMDDPQGRRVRKKHAARYTVDGIQTWLWDNMETATHKHMEMSFKNKRQQVVMDCHQLKLDVDRYNENFNRGKRIQIVFDFRNDLEELDLGAKGRPAA